MGNFKKFMAMAAVSCMALTTMTACGNSGDAGSGDGDTKEIKIGLNYELSGETANYGTPEYNGSMLAIKQANANKDNKFSYKAVKGDNKSQADEYIRWRKGNRRAGNLRCFCGYLSDCIR